MGRRAATANASGYNAPHIPGPSVSPQDVIDEAKIVNFDDEKSWKEFQKKYQDHLEKNLEVRVEDGVLHIVAKEGKKFPNYREFTKWAIKHHKQLLKNKDHGGYPPLHLALSRSNHGFVSLVLEHAVDIRMLLEQYTVQALTCLHRAIWDRSPFTKAILDIINGGQGDINSIKNTPRADNGISGSVDVFTIASTDASQEVKKDCIPGMTALHFAVTSELKDPKDDIEYC